VSRFAVRLGDRGYGSGVEGKRLGVRDRGWGLGDSEEGDLGS